MCGIAGFFQKGVVDLSLERIVARMSDTLIHRGPDDSGIWVDATFGLGLGHRRLSILDLTSAGKQPMHSACNRYVIAFNGEIYNHLDLRQQLAVSKGRVPVWRGHADTETLLACFEEWGIEKGLQSCVGMFAFAVWDRQERVLTLARDRMGEKPLYYGWQGDILLFGSELKAIKAHPIFSGEIDRDALALFLRHSCVPAPYCIYKGMAKLMPGHYLSFPLSNPEAAKLVTPVAYWRLNDAAESGQSHLFTGTANEAVDLLEKQLSQSVAEQMLADVPVGAFLSGGVDSSTIVALMQAQSSRPIRTFTIGFDEGGYDEAVYAKAVARHLGTEHTELYVSPKNAQAVISLLPSMYCEPFSDSSQIPTFLVSEMARQSVTVALSGDGGDELFGGYNRYLSARKVWSKMQSLPAPARLMVTKVLKSFAPETWDRLFELVRPFLSRRLYLENPGEKARKLAGVLCVADKKVFFQQLASHWNDPAGIVINAHEPQTLLTDSATWPMVDSFEHWMMAIDTQTFLADDILVKVDRAAMANGLETRVPMLDHRIVELAWKMPLDLKIHNGQGKWLLRQVLCRHVPQELIDRPKMGFGIPLDKWLRGPLRDWAEALLDESRLQQEGYFHSAAIRQKWMEHVSGRRNWQYHLWDVLMFQAWLTEQKA